MFKKDGKVYTLNQIRALYPNTSFAESTPLELGFTRYIVPHTPVQQTAESLANQMAMAIENHLNSKAQEYRYKDYHAAMAYVGSPVAKFNNEAVAFRDWVSLVWAYVDQLEQDVLNGVVPAPSSAQEIIQNLPVLSL